MRTLIAIAELVACSTLTYAQSERMSKKEKQKAFLNERGPDSSSSKGGSW